MAAGLAVAGLAVEAEATGTKPWQPQPAQATGRGSEKGFPPRCFTCCRMGGLGRVEGPGRPQETAVVGAGWAGGGGAEGRAWHSPVVGRSREDPRALAGPVPLAFSDGLPVPCRLGSRSPPGLGSHPGPCPLPAALSPSASRTEVFYLS